MALNRVSVDRWSWRPHLYRYDYNCCNGHIGSHTCISGSERPFTPMCVWSLRSLVCFLLCLTLKLADGKAWPSTISQHCNKTNVLEQNEKYNFRLAVKNNGDWLICRSGNSEDSAYRISVDGAVEFKWAVPASDNYEIVYASTTTSPGHPLSLYRNSAAGVIESFIPFYSSPDLKLITELDKKFKPEFIAYHRMSGSIDEDLKTGLEKWHNTKLWLPSRSSKEVVKSGLLRHAELLNQQESPLATEHGAERLIRVTRGREKTSWITFRSQEPSKGHPLIVTLYYSADPQGSTVHRFFFMKGS